MNCYNGVILIFLVFHLNITVILNFNLDELSCSYDVDILQAPIRKEDVQTQHTVSMTSKYGQEYQCILPNSEGEKLLEKETMAEKETDIKELLKSDRCLLKKKDWWTYEFCFGKHIKQYHVEAGKISSPVLTLGLYDSDYDWNNETNQDKFEKTKQKYHSQYYVGGTKCDLNGQPRNAEVRFFCEDGVGDYILRVDEPGTCTYLITIHTSRICSHPKLQPLLSKKTQSIRCHPVLNDQQYATYLQRLKKKEFTEQSQEPKNQQQRSQSPKNTKSSPETSENIRKPDSFETKRSDPQKETENERAEKEFADKNLSQGRSQSQKESKSTIQNIGDIDRVKTSSDPQIEIENEKDSSISTEDSKQVSISTDDAANSKEQLVRIPPLGSNGDMYELNSAERTRLEQALKDKLKKYGLDAEGHKIAVKVVNAGFSATGKKKKIPFAFKEGDKIMFANRIRAYLRQKQESALEEERHLKLEENYKYEWEDDEE